MATGHLGLGFALLVLSSVPDLLDGAVAKASSTASPRGAFFDSTADRVSDTLVIGGIGWYLASTNGPHAAMLAFAVLGASALIPYQRAKAESLGFVAKGGIMERAERIVALGIGLAFSALLVPILWIMLTLSLFTAGQRFVRVWRQASAPRARRYPTLEDRWQAWRIASTTTLQANRQRREAASDRWRSRRHELLASRRWSRRTDSRS